MSIYKGMELFVKANDTERRGYYEHARAGRYVVQRCDSCERLRSFFAAACPFCTSLSWSWQELSGEGEIYSWQVVTHAVQPAFKDWVPYPVVLVQLDEQPFLPWRSGEEDETVSLRVIGNLCQRDDPSRPESEDNVAIGRRVEVCFIDLSEEFALPQFRLAAT